MNELVSPKLDDLNSQFDKLEKDTHDKGERLFDAKRADLYDQSCDDIDTFVKDVHAQIEAEPMEELKDLVGVNIMIQKQQLIETQMLVKTQQLTDLNSQATHLERIEPENKEKIEWAHKVFDEIKEPIHTRKQELMKKKETFQFKRDVEDENLWTDEKLALASSQEVGNSLQAVNLLLKKHKMMQQEVSNHEQRVNAVVESGDKLISEHHPESEKFQRDLDNMTEKWARLQELLDARKQRLLVSEKAQQFFFDANEAEAWMSEQELYMMVEDRGKDEFSAQNLMKKHEALEASVTDYRNNVRDLGEIARQLIAEGHPDSEAIGIRLAQVDKLYAGLRDLAAERRAKLDDALKLFMLNREVDDLEQWIAEREVVAGSHELGQDYEHVTLLWERFLEFARDTESIGCERVSAVNEIADSLIGSGHTDAATIAQWKDGLNDSWADLGELIDTRTQMLEASRELHKYFHDCKDVLGRIFEKKNSMPDELGRDGGSVSALQRKHANFIQDLQGLENQVRIIQEESAKLQSAYAGDKAMEITNREREVVRAWLELQGMGDNRNNKLNDTSDLFKFFQMVRNPMVWMDDLVRQMSTSEKPRDVSGVELLMNSHQNHKAEIDARESNFSECISLGKELLTRNHYASNEIKEKLVELTEQRNGMLHKWEERWEHLQLILEVYQFARDAAVAEAWLIAQDPYLKSEDLGHTIDEVENLIKKHEAFEKAAAAQEERFVALERLTTFELKELKRRKDEDESRRRQEEIEKSTPVRHHADRPEGERGDSGSIKSGTAKETGSMKRKSSGGPPPPHAAAAAIQEQRRRSSGVQVTQQPSAAHGAIAPSPTTSPEEQTDSDGLEGMLVRKHEWENTTKKAPNRSWDKVCVILRGTQIRFYKDIKAYKTSPDATYRGEIPIDVVGATAEIASDYKKKPHVFRLKLANCGEYLFQASSDEEMGAWVNAINQIAIEDEGAAGGAGRSQTLPEQGRKDEPKKRSFFTLKKK